MDRCSLTGPSLLRGSPVICLKCLLLSSPAAVGRGVSEKSGAKGRKPYHHGREGLRAPRDQRFWSIGASSLSIPFARKWLKSSLEKLSEKGYEQRSSRAFGHYTEGDMDRMASLWRPAGLSCRHVRGFSDSFRRRFLGSPVAYVGVVRRP